MTYVGMFSSVFNIYDLLVINMFISHRRLQPVVLGPHGQIQFVVSVLTSHECKHHIYSMLFVILHTSLTLVVETPHEFRNSLLVVHKICTWSNNFWARLTYVYITLQKSFVQLPASQKTKGFDMNFL
jgi:hypothetical protein